MPHPPTYGKSHLDNVQYKIQYASWVNRCCNILFTSHTVLFMRFVVIVISLALYSWDKVLLYRADCPRTQVCLSLPWELGFHVCTTTPGYSFHIFTVSMLGAVSAKGWLYFKTFKNQQGMDDLRDDKDTEPKLLGIWKIGLLSLNCSESVSCV